MTNGVQSPPEPSVTGLLKGIIADFGDLIRQEIRFARSEVKSDLKKTKEASAILCSGIAVAVLGTFLLAWMLVYLLHWFTIPTDAAITDPGKIPLWGCFGIVGAGLLAIGAAVMQAGKKKFDSFNPLPDETAKTVKENVEWITNSK